MPFGVGPDFLKIHFEQELSAALCLLFQLALWKCVLLAGLGGISPLASIRTSNPKWKVAGEGLPLAGSDGGLDRFLLGPFQHQPFGRPRSIEFIIGRVIMIGDNQLVSFGWYLIALSGALPEIR